ncbi:MAG: c-type cytochrome [Pedosphaera sp.]|nr:c-type cytochrome [Pedosphaera sp.]
MFPPISVSRTQCALIVSWVLTCHRIAADAPAADVVPFAGLTAEEACAKATLPSGFRMHPFAAEPELKNPIAFCEDDRGRLWVVEGLTYPRRRGNPPGPGRGVGDQQKDIFNGADRILVFEDTDGDHKADRTTVFMENLNLVSGIQYGFGGIWVGAAPYLLFIPVTEGDSPKPAGVPQIVLDGWDYKADAHETLNTFTWGPDGWLYGCHGVFCPSHVGKPGAPEKDRQWMDAGVWRFHPTRHQFEVFAEGTSNPWGVDFDAYGQCWIEACVIPHLWHMIQGGRYERQGGEHFTVGPGETLRNEEYRETRNRKPRFPFVFEDIKTVADHTHYAGSGGPHAGNGRSDSAGGGHAHAGMLCYLGLSWPEEFQGRLLMGNIHGQRLNMDIPETVGSGYVGRHGPDFLMFNDSWSQTLNQRLDPDGSVFVIDWYDRNQCHHNREDGHDRSNGRIYKVVYNNQAVTPLDLQKSSDSELVTLATSPNTWLSRHAQRLLQERIGRAGEQLPMPDGIPASLAPWMRPVLTARQTPALDGLKSTLLNATDTTVRLRALWTRHVTGALRLEELGQLVRDPDAWIRSWAIHLFCENAFLYFGESGQALREVGDRSLDDLTRIAREDSSPIVRRHIASGLQRLPVEDRWRPMIELVQHAEDASDHNLPLLYWYAAEGCVVSNPERAMDLLRASRIPQIREFIARRLALLSLAYKVSGESMQRLSQFLGETPDETIQFDVVRGIKRALEGRTNAPMPAGWSTLEPKLARAKNVQLRSAAELTSLKFGSETARQTIRRSVVDESIPLQTRATAFEALRGVRDPEVPTLLVRLLADPGLRGAAIRGLAAFQIEETPKLLIEGYNSYTAIERRDALNTLASRVSFARPLVGAVASTKIPKTDLTADLVRQMRSLKNPELSAQLDTLWGVMRETSTDMRQEVEHLKRQYWAGGSQPGDAPRGRVVYNRSCAPCHRLFDTGGDVGPDITGANRTDLDYLLETIVFPNAVIPNEYRVSTVELKDGRVVTGIVKSQEATSLVIQTANERITLQRSEVIRNELSETSMMPEGSLASISQQEMRDLIYYLGRPGQVPLPTTK